MIYWIWMTLIPQIGPVLANRLLEKFKTPDQIFKADEKALRLIKGINNRRIESIQNSKSLEEAEEILNLCKKKKFQFLQSKITNTH